MQKENKLWSLFTSWRYFEASGGSECILLSELNQSFTRRNLSYTYIYKHMRVYACIYP